MHTAIKIPMNAPIAASNPVENPPNSHPKRKAGDIKIRIMPSSGNAIINIKMSNMMKQAPKIIRSVVMKNLLSCFLRNCTTDEH